MAAVAHLGYTERHRPPRLRSIYLSVCLFVRDFTKIDRLCAVRGYRLSGDRRATMRKFTALGGDD